jgi:hypothetical protein
MQRIAENKDPPHLQHQACGTLECCVLLEQHHEVGKYQNLEAFCQRKNLDQIRETADAAATGAVSYSDP